MVSMSSRIVCLKKTNKIIAQNHAGDMWGVESIEHTSNGHNTDS